MRELEMAGTKDGNAKPNAKRARANLAIALALFAFVALVFIITITRLGGRVFEGGM